MKGLLVGILENKKIGNCSLNGISSKVSQVILVGEGIPEIFEASIDTPAVKLIKRNIYGKNYLHCEPYKSLNAEYYMMGGCFIWSSDSRFPSDYPIPLHDRHESQELNERLSK